MMQKQNDTEQIKQANRNNKKEYAGYRAPTKEDLRRLLIYAGEERYNMERSFQYMGYKMLWIIQMALEGKKFPSQGQLETDQWRAHVYDISIWLTIEDCLRILVDFDSNLFFRVIARLFYGQPWCFLLSMKVESKKNRALRDFKTPQEIIMTLQAYCEKAERLAAVNSQLGKSKVLEHFYHFILEVQYHQIAEKEDMQKKMNAQGAGAGPAVIKRRAAGLETPQMLAVDKATVIKAIHKGLTDERTN